MPRRKTLLGDHPLCTAASMDDSYEAGDVIGTGSFGIIRKVTRKVDGLVLARKELNFGRMDDRDLRQLTEEVNILEQLGSNDHIVRYYERFVDKPNNMLYILMEYCEGGDLARIIQRCRTAKTPLSEDTVWSYLAQLTLALHDCHCERTSQGKAKPVILHRDLKPDNVFLDKDSNLKLGDFGLSKAMAQAAMTQTYVGTPYYMSPELIHGQPYDVKSDIWSLGCLIYELCAGHPPFHEARTQPELATLIRDARIPDLPQIYSQHLNQVVRAMLKQNPRHRPSTGQIKNLDAVKLQVRALQLRKATAEVRFREHAVSTREKDLLDRERTLLEREQLLSAKEAMLRVSEQKLQQIQASIAASDRENQRPDAATAIARAASRPSLVPRRPQDDRKLTSLTNTPLRAHGQISRTDSFSSLMSLDCTPGKSPVSVARRRLASKSMHNLSAKVSASETSDGNTTERDTNVSPLDNHRRRSSVSSCAGRSGPSFGLPLPSSASSAQANAQVEATTRASEVNEFDDDSDLPSPFIKPPRSRPDSISTARLANARPGAATKPTLASRLLASRALGQRTPKSVAGSAF
ncbi:hypothetical protein ACM66B_000228 [Microbotryomycetes sp. NB124-2]